jgi:hypothetical protein
MTANQLLLDLQSEMWDFYKDVHGIRPRHWTKENWDSMEFLQEQRILLCDIIDKFTTQERKDNGWL